MLIAQVKYSSRSEYNMSRGDVNGPAENEKARFSATLFKKKKIFISNELPTSHSYLYKHPTLDLPLLLIRAC
jgi:hypothetical protein